MNTAAIITPSISDSVQLRVRVSTIDLMRGIVMVIMALDHVRDFFHYGGAASNPTDLATTTPALFFTRWITHFCAPTFVFLAGTSIYLNSVKKSKSELSLFLLTRGLWLVLLELIVVRFGIFFNLYYDVFLFQVIWVIGASMICMALLIHLKYAMVITIGFLLVFTHNIGDFFPMSQENPFFLSWALIRQSGFIVLPSGTAVMAFYPLLPWLGIMILGYGFGRIYTSGLAIEARKKLLMQLGLSAIALFIILRAINLYGDPALWSQQKNFVFTVMSFLNTTKYPPSLLYTLMTLGPVLILLSVMEGRSVNFLRPLEVFGRVPLFYYILHFYIIHFVSLLFFMQKTGKSFSDIDFHFGSSFGGLTAEAGYSLFWVYVVWITLVLVLYPLCKWYNSYKSTHRHWWLSYL